MRWKQFFTPVTSINSQQAQELLKNNYDFELLDVRQPNEYSQGHIAGATLIPLPELGDSLHLLSDEKTYIIY